MVTSMHSFNIVDISGIVDHHC